MNITPAKAEQPLHRLPRQAVMEIVAPVLVAATGIVEMGEIELLDPLLIHQPEQVEQLERPGSGNPDALNERGS